MSVRPAQPITRSDDSDGCARFDVPRASASKGHCFTTHDNW